MLKVECESCRAPYQVDERRVPEAGLKMRCPKCGNSFLVKDPSKTAGHGPARPMKQTMVGFGGDLPSKAGMSTRPPPPLRKTPVSVVQAAPLPDGVTEAPRAPVHSRPTPRAFLAVTDEGVVALPANKSAEKSKAGVTAPPPAPSGFDRSKHAHVTSPDLPAVTAPKGAAPSRDRAIPPVLAPPTVPPPAKVAGPSFELDLPDVRPDLGPTRDLPQARTNPPDVGLPTSKKTTSRNELGAEPPIVKPGLRGESLPKASAYVDLPKVSPGSLPSPTNKGAPPVPGRPSRPDSFDLPVLASELRPPAAAPPMVSSPDAGGRVPTMEEALGFGDLALSSPTASVPKAASTLSFGELDLAVSPPAAAPANAPSQASAQAKDFGSLDLDAGAKPTSSSTSNAGSMFGGSAFGELDLGRGKENAGVELSLRAEGGAPKQDRPQSTLEHPAPVRPRETTPRPSRKGPKIAFAGLLALVLGGAALQLTPVGAFGHLAIADMVHATSYVKEAASIADATQKKLASDVFVPAREAADNVAQLHDATPRSRPLAAYAAFVEFENQARFGSDASRAARAKSFLSDFPQDADVPYLLAARAAESLLDGDFTAAKTKIDAAAAHEQDAGVKFDLDILQGLAALGRKDAPGAVQAFSAALAKDGASARAHWGLARSYFLSKDLPKVKQEVDAILRTSPTHAGARTMHAWLAWLSYQDGAAALAELDVVLDDPSRATMAPSEVASALAIKGGILLALDRGSEARTAFERAVALDPQNIPALVGQGQNLYSSGRYTEALTRFDEAVRRDPSNIAAIVGSAMAKISLERVDEAKKQLAAARKIDPNDMSLALWLAKAEEALGDKSSAETDYSLATTLAKPENKDAVLAYAAFAAFLASQGRAAEAQGKLDEARKKVQDSATLDRAFGDIAAAQGKFDGAVAYYLAALKKSPNDLATRFRLASTYRRMRKFDLATAELDRIAESDKDYPGMALERGLLFEESGNVEKALEQFRSAYQKAPNDPDLALRVGAALVTIGKIDEGLPLLLKVQEKRADSAEVNHYLGRAYLKKGGTESAQAMRLLQRAAELDPNRAEYHLYVAWAANEAIPAQLGLARASVEKALSLDQLLADGYWQRGIVKLREGAIDDAVKDLKYALQLKPNRFEAHATLAECYEQKNETGMAASEWEKAIAGDATRPYWRYHYGRILLDRGQIGEAAKHLSFALDAAKQMQPKPGWLPRLAFDTGEALRKSGQKKEAIDAYELYMGMAAPTAPDRKDAIAGLKALGAPSAANY